MNYSNMEELSPQTIERIHFQKGHRELRQAILVTVVFSLFLKLDSVLRLGDYLYNRQINSTLLFTLVVSFRFLMGIIAVFLIIPYILNEEISKTRVKVMVNLSNTNTFFGLISGIIFISLASILALASDVLNPDFTLLFSAPNVYVEPDNVGWYYFVLALIPAIFEEFTFRGILFQKLKYRYSKRMTILLSSTCFSLFHLAGIVNKPLDEVIGGMIMAFLFGLVWGDLVYRSNSLTPSMMSHYIIDTIGLVFITYNNVDSMVLATFMTQLTFLYPILHLILNKFFGNTQKPS